MKKSINYYTFHTFNTLTKIKNYNCQLNALYCQSYIKEKIIKIVKKSKKKNSNNAALLTLKRNGNNNVNSISYKIKKTQSIGKFILI